LRERALISILMFKFNTFSKVYIFIIK
jgi:hypothetical protein